MNRYTLEEDTGPDVLHVDEQAAYDHQIERLREIRDERDGDAVERHLESLRTAIRGDENVMPHIVDAVKAYATMGEVMDVFEAEHGSYRETAGLAR